MRIKVSRLNEADFYEIVNNAQHLSCEVSIPHILDQIGELLGVFIEQKDYEASLVELWPTFKENDKKILASIYVPDDLIADEYWIIQQMIHDLEDERSELRERIDQVEEALGKLKLVKARNLIALRGGK
ncbi:MAG: hypothetical protein CUN56_00125 [Phototrophicales bacterium]|nr:MAG: hypothetical protein CUN56_00125 [Phototrophicales bacterium]